MGSVMDDVMSLINWISYIGHWLELNEYSRSTASGVKLTEADQIKSNSKLKRQEDMMMSCWASSVNQLIDCSCFHSRMMLNVGNQQIELSCKWQDSRCNGKKNASGLRRYDAVFMGIHWYGHGSPTKQQIKRNKQQKKSEKCTSYYWELTAINVWVFRLEYLYYQCSEWRQEHRDTAIIRSNHVF